MSFWNLGTANPKRKFRFEIQLSGGPYGVEGGSPTAIWYAKSCTAPSVEISSVEHMWSDHVFNFPGRAKWGDVEMVLVDPSGGGGDTSGDMAPSPVSDFLSVLKTFGYDPDGPNGTVVVDSYETISRNKQGVNVIINALDDNGKAIETWNLKHAFPIAFKFGDWDYGTDDLREMSVTWKYDFAEMTPYSEPGTEATDKYFGS